MTNSVSGAILPYDVLVDTLSFLTPLDASLAALSCRWWAQIIREDGRLRAQFMRNESVLPLAGRIHTLPKGPARQVARAAAEGLNSFHKNYLDLTNRIQNV